MNCRRFKENLTSLKLLSYTSSRFCGMKLSFTKLFSNTAPETRQN